MTLVNGWVLFQFLYEEDREIIEGQYWVLGQGSLVLRSWHVGFNPHTERLLRRHLWVILPDFSIQC